MAKLSQLRVRFYLTYDVVKNLREGQPIFLELQVTGQQVRGQVDFISPITSPDSGTARVEILLDNPGLKIRSGQPCRWVQGQMNSPKLKQVSTPARRNLARPKVGAAMPTLRGKK